MKYFWNWVFNTQVWTNLTGYLFWWFDFCFVPMGFFWLAFPSQVKKGVSPHEVRRRFDDEAVATKVAVRWVVNGSWPLPNVEGMVIRRTWSVSWKLAVHMLPLFYIFLYNCNILYPYWPLWTTVLIFLTFTCHFWSSPPRLRRMQVVELIRKVIPLKAGMINSPQETSIFRVNMETCWEWLGNTDLMISWANEPCGGRYRTFILVRMFDVRWLESPTNITVLTQGLKVFSPAYLWLLLFTHSNRAPLTSLAEMIVPLVNVGRSWVVRHIQLGNATYEKHVSTILFVSLWWSKCACVCACVSTYFAMWPQWTADPCIPKFYHPVQH